MRLCRVEFQIVVAAGLLVGMPTTVPGQPVTSPASVDSSRELQRSGSRDPFEGVVSPSLYDSMAADSRARRRERAAPVESRLVASWTRLRRHSTAYRGPADPFADPFEERSPATAPYREPATSASRRPGQGDAGWFGGTARGAEGRAFLPPGWPDRMVPAPMGAFVPPIRTIPDPMLQPPGRGVFGSGQGPGSGGPFGFDNNVITGGDPNPTGPTQSP